MSIKIMTKVWEHSKQGGSPLLLLLAIADNANDSGFSWPGQEYLANKIRMSTKSIPRIANKLQKAGELFVHNRSSEGKVTQYVVLTDMTWEQFATTLRLNLNFNEKQIVKAQKWFKDKGRQDEPPPSCTPPTAMGRGVDIAVSRGVDIAVSTEPSLPVNESSLTPNGENGSSKLPETESTPPPEPKTNHKLTDQQAGELLIFGKHPDSDSPNSSFNTIQEIRAAGWIIRDHIVEQVIAYYIEPVRKYIPTFSVPNNKSVRDDWYKAVKGHLQDYRADQLKVMYPAAVDRLKDRSMTFSRPGSLTKSLPDVAMETGDVVAWL